MYARSRCFSVAVLLALVAVAPVLAAPSGIGLTGGLQVPSPITLKPETYEVGVTVEGFRERNLSTSAVETTADIGLKINVGIYDNLEMGLEKTIRSSSDLRDDDATVQFKYRLPVESFNLSVGTVFSTGGIDYSSAYVVGGWKALYMGVGLNFGGSRLEEITLNTIRRFGTAKFGGYNLRHVTTLAGETFIGEPEEFFAIVGADFKLSDYFSMLMDFNGDRFAAGFRFRLKDFNVDLAYVGQSETDALLDRDSMNFQFGAGVRF